MYPISKCNRDGCGTDIDRPAHDDPLSNNNADKYTSASPNPNFDRNTRGSCHNPGS